MTFREIDVRECDPVARPRPGAAPELVWLRIESLLIDEDYQRPLGPKNWKAIRRIASAFEWPRFTPVIAARLSDKRYAIIDGQHRAHAAALAGISAIPAMVVEADPSGQAAAFAAINRDRTVVSGYHLLKAALAAGDADALTADRAVTEAGCRLMTYVVSSVHRAPRQVFSIALVLSHVRAGRSRVVTEGLRAITQSPLVNQVDAYRDNVLDPWFATLAARPELDAAAFCADHDLTALCTRLDALREEAGRRRDSGRKLALLNLDRAIAAWGGPRVRPEPVSRPVLAQSERREAIRPAPEVQKEAPPKAPPAVRPEHWTEDRDALLIAEGGTHAGRASLAEGWGMSTAQVTARWHKVRARA
ncbi:ParB/RepB/Spo0J family partition protein [Seohaeicola nanhaiensis]|uniref:ParB/RepB/Spo0J family partition protein n=1 Tax=Seohaeicola nanhaiensis TaxID=1387282 RepID=A0ABV9KEE2_9RHOB